MIVSFEDYLSMCQSSLMKAVRGFDEKKNVTFYTFFFSSNPLTAFIKELSQIDK